MSDRFQKVFFPGSILMLWLMLFAESLAGRSAWMFFFEVFQQWLPYKEFISACYRAGSFPLWTHNMECGFPFAAFPHTQSFYILNPVFFFMDYARAISIASFIYVLILCYGAYFCGRELEFSRLSSWMLSLTSGMTGMAFLSAGSPP